MTDLKVWFVSEFENDNRTGKRARKGSLFCSAENFPKLLSDLTGEFGENSYWATVSGEEEELTNLGKKVKGWEWFQKNSDVFYSFRHNADVLDFLVQRGWDVSCSVMGHENE